MMVHWLLTDSQVIVNTAENNTFIGSIHSQKLPFKKKKIVWNICHISYMSCPPIRYIFVVCAPGHHMTALYSQSISCTERSASRKKPQLGGF